jgi:hypothetical protein
LQEIDCLAAQKTVKKGPGEHEKVLAMEPERRSAEVVGAALLTFMTEPAARPNSAANWLVISRISWTMSVLLIGC